MVENRRIPSLPLKKVQKFPFSSSRMMLSAKNDYDSFLFYIKCNFASKIKYFLFGFYVFIYFYIFYFYFFIKQEFRGFMSLKPFYILI